jgi:8-oxo-dGTP pyrophosphatase MutT (NUDIX family)
MSGQVTSRRWTIHAERVVDDSRKTKLHIAAVELPDGVRFEQYVLRCPKAAMVVAVNDVGEMLMIRRHRFIVDADLWELPGGYVDDGEDLQAAALRELEEETGWRAERCSLLVRYQPMVGMADHECLVYLAEDVTSTGAAPDINEAELVEWLPFERAQKMLTTGEIQGARRSADTAPAS